MNVTFVANVINYTFMFIVTFIQKVHLSRIKTIKDTVTQIPKYTYFQR